MRIQVRSSRGLMHKLMFVCSRCGFTAFVERQLELEIAGWWGETRDDGTSVVTCADCVAESAPDQDSVATPRARTNKAST
jgi:hypothetical protein